MMMHKEMIETKDNFVFYSPMEVQEEMPMFDIF